MNDDRRLIEETFPVREVGEESAREKNIRHGHISTLHIWWARRPLASSRATAYAALVPPPENEVEWQKQRDFIIELSKWENSLNPHLLQRARKDIYQAHAERLSEELGTTVTIEDIESGKYPPPRVLDPFAGGGAIPLEALRLGCETYASDYNPVAVLILKATLEYPQKFGRPFDDMPEHLLNIIQKKDDENNNQIEIEQVREQRATYLAKNFNPLLEAVKYWGNWVLEEARKELERFYPHGANGEIPVGYIWARTVPCQNPVCGVEIPLMRQFWLAKKGKKKEIALHLLTDGPGQPIRFEIVARGTQITGNEDNQPWPEGYDPTNGTVSRAVVNCPACGATMDANTNRKLFQEGKSGQRMVVVVYTLQGVSGKFYRLANESDLQTFIAAQQALQEKKELLRQEWGLEPVPDEFIHTPDGKEYIPGGLLYNFTPVVLYGITRWKHLFNPRQQLFLITFVHKLRQAHSEMVVNGYSPDFAQALVTYLGLNLNRIADKNSVLCRVIPQTEAIGFTYGRQALPMLWDYIEMNPFEHNSGWKPTCDEVENNLKHLSKIQNSKSFVITVTQASATDLPYLNNHFDSVLTDPPYYDNIPYADLSDFFYVWLKRSIGYLHTELFSTPNTPKSQEAIAELPLLRGMNKEKVVNVVKNIKTSKNFELILGQAFKEIHRVLKPGGVAIIVYAHKSTEGWETVINALLDSGLVVNGAWPINTEMQTRLRASESAALASSIYIVARKMERQGTGFYNEVREELRKHLNKKLQRLWEEGIGGADFFIAAIGSAIEVFGKYEKVMDFEGNIIRADRLLDEVRNLATDFAVRQILQNGFVEEVSDRARFYVLWRWEYAEARVPFDEARKLAQSCGLDLAQEWNRRGSFVKKEKEFIRLLGPHQRDIKELQQSTELVDVIHVVLRLWEKGQQTEIIQILSQNGYGQSEVFYRVAQAISESLPIESKEKKLLDGFLAGRERVKKAIAQNFQQGELFD